MTHIARTALNAESNFHIALSKIFGIGRASALNISETCGISKDMKVRAFRSFPTKESTDDGGPYAHAHAASN